MRIQSVVLEHHGDVPLLRRHIVDDAVADADLPAGDVLQPGDQSAAGVDFPQPMGRTRITNSPYGCPPTPREGHSSIRKPCETRGFPPRPCFLPIRAALTAAPWQQYKAALRGKQAVTCTILHNVFDLSGQPWKTLAAMPSNFQCTAKYRKSAQITAARSDSSTPLNWASCKRDRGRSRRPEPHADPAPRRRPPRARRSVGITDGGEAMGDDERRTAFREGSQCPLDLSLGLRVEGRGRLVEDEDRRILQEGPSRWRGAASAARQAHAALTHHCVEPIRQTIDERSEAGALRAASAISASVASRRP